MNVIERLVKQLHEVPDERVARSAEAGELAVQSKATLERVDRLIRLARMDAAVDVVRARARAVHR